MISKSYISISLILVIALILAIGGSETSSSDVETNGFRIEVPYKDFFSECRENHNNDHCKWKFLLISSPPSAGSTGILSSEGYDLTLPVSNWNRYNYRKSTDLYPHCSKDVASSLIHEVSEQRRAGGVNWIAVLPNEFSRCFNATIAGYGAGTDEYWAIKGDTLFASISCKPHGSVPNPNCGIKIYLRDGSIVVSGGYFPYVNIESFLFGLNEIMLRLSDRIPVEEYRYEMKEIFADRYEISHAAENMASRTKDEIDGKY